uniref:ATP synthase complex subunit 8 n=1 Tax=Bostrichoidea sp. 7 KM-2017 TaxID=2219281 RepID=A0A346RGW6_9COLE|nr:ATP synthase F0 subunit 8 [Bostrichoidea sp. 7 KM-2017]
MPQMAPLNWVTLFIFFTSILLIMNTMNFFYKTPLETTKTSHKKTIKNWKW